MLTNELTGQPITDEELQSLADLVRHQMICESNIAALQVNLADLQKRLKKVSEVAIPELLLGMGLTQLKMSTGEVVTVDKYYSASIPKDRQLEAFEWLRSTGNDDIIKNELKLLFGKGEDELAKQFAEKLIELGRQPEQKVFVHPMTLKSFVRERMESGQELPQDLLGVFVGNKTKIAQPKK